MEKVIKEANDIQALKALVLNMFEVVDTCSECLESKMSFKTHDYDCGLLCNDCLAEFQDQEESTDQTAQDMFVSMIKSLT